MRPWRVRLAAGQWSPRFAGHYFVSWPALVCIIIIIIINGIITSAIIIHTYAHRCTLYISASAVAQILYNSRDRHLHISTLLSLLSTLHFSVLGLRHILNISHSDQVFIIIVIDTLNFTIITIIPLLRISHVQAKCSSLSFIIDTLNFTIITIITLLCISRTERYATCSDPHVSQNWSRVHIPKNSFMYIF